MRSSSLNIKNAHGVFLPYLISDQSPAVLVIPNGLIHKLRSFRFVNYIADKEEFLPLVEQGWNKQVQGYEMYRVIKRLKDMKRDLNKLNWKNGNLFTQAKLICIHPENLYMGLFWWIGQRVVSLLPMFSELL